MDLVHVVRNLPPSAEEEEIDDEVEVEMNENAMP